MIKDKSNYLGEALNGRDIPDSLKRQGVALLGFFSSYKLLAEVSKINNNHPTQITLATCIERNSVIIDKT